MTDPPGDLTACADTTCPARQRCQRFARGIPNRGRTWFATFAREPAADQCAFLVPLSTTKETP